MQFKKISVQAYAGYKANERPVCFALGLRQYRVVEILDRWYEGYNGPAKLDYYKVLADDGQEYILRYNSLFDAWSLLIDDAMQGN